MATLTAVAPSIAGVAFSPAAAAGGGDQFLNTGREVLYVANGGGGSINVTLNAQSYRGVSFSDPVVAVANGAAKVIGPFDPTIFNDSSGFLGITYSGVTSVTVAVLQVP